MSLFNIVRKKKGESAPKAAAPSCSCSCSGNGASAEGTAPSSCCGKEVSGICCIKVLGAGCKNCHTQYENAKMAAAALGLNIEVEYITDMEKVMAYGVMSMPAIVINDQVVSMGKVLKAAEVQKLLAEFGA